MVKAGNSQKGAPLEAGSNHDFCYRVPSACCRMRFLGHGVADREHNQR
jgi:hypothetical protein